MNSYGPGFYLPPRTLAVCKVRVNLLRGPSYLVWRMGEPPGYPIMQSFHLWAFFHPEKQVQISQDRVRCSGEKDLFTVMIGQGFLVFFFGLRQKVIFDGFNLLPFRFTEYDQYGEIILLRHERAE